jgi:ATP-dependent Lhr-like helicase
VTDRAVRLALKKRLGRTWGAFFERYGNFTPVQVAAIPRLLEGQNIVICAPTASGKTEAAVVPLIERHCAHINAPGITELTILYITPTRALVNDLLGRLAVPLDSLRISLASKTHDVSTFDPQSPAQILITTPESVDSLLAAHAQLFANLRAIIIDELHLFDGTPRGDQLRMLIRRVRQIRTHAAVQGDAPDDYLHMVALSATLTDPQRVAARYMDEVQVIQDATRRALDIELLPLAEDSAQELLDYARSFRSKGWRKALVFCNSRAEVESYAAALQERSPFGSAVFAHYSNIAPQRRLEIEEQFALAEVALCVATSTLELGIDIGNIDVVILIGPPGDVNSFAQRIGRGNRRQTLMHVACFFRSPLERLVFEALKTALEDERAVDSAEHFRLSVAIQQVFSLIKQSPMGSVRLRTLTQLLEGLVAADDVQSMIGHLQRSDYLKAGRPGDWQPGERLNSLFDQQASAYCELSIYSNIRSSITRPVEVRDQYTHQTVASVDAQWLARPVLTLEGRTLDVEWIDGEAIWVTVAQPKAATGKLHYQGTRKYLQFDLAQLLPRQFGLEPHQTPILAAPDGWWWFHWLGDLYAHVLLGLLKLYLVVERTELPGLCFVLRDDPRTLAWPSWEEVSIRHYVESRYRSLERMLDLGPFQHLLPVTLRRHAVVDQFDVPTFMAALSRMELTPAPEQALKALSALVS